jgi:hypothetical protein
LSESGEVFLRRRAFFKSALAPALSETESIMRTESLLESWRQDKVVYLVHEVIRHGKFDSSPNPTKLYACRKNETQALHPRHLSLGLH